MAIDCHEWPERDDNDQASARYVQTVPLTGFPTAGGLGGSSQLSSVDCSKVPIALSAWHHCQDPHALVLRLF
jgi:hypothetical protein